tara:strand:+ start:98 stop:250 length:153 start_codon:yes stop_codon:yes gene_type:complete
MGKVIKVSNDGKDIVMSGRARDPENIDFLIEFIGKLIEAKEAKDGNNGTR